MVGKKFKKAAWLTDLHLDSLEPSEVLQVLDRVKSREPDCLFITGDIADGDSVESFLLMLEDNLEMPVYFTLGNHDYHEYFIEEIRNRMRTLTEQCENLVWLPHAGVVELNDTTALIGHDCWNDGMYGDFIKSDITLNDYTHIKDLKDLDQSDLLAKLKELGIDSARYIETQLTAALEQYNSVFLLTHIPPFEECVWHNGQKGDWRYNPHFACKAVGDMLKEKMTQNPQKRLTVLSGHTHTWFETKILPNIKAYVGEAGDFSPKVQKVFHF